MSTEFGCSETMLVTRSIGESMSRTQTQIAQKIAGGITSGPNELRNHDTPSPTLRTHKRSYVLYMRFMSADLGEADNRTSEYSREHRDRRLHSVIYGDGSNTSNVDRSSILTDKLK